MTPYLDTNMESAGCLILAGGQGTRLGIQGPKGCVALPLNKQPTLFELILKKVKNKKAPIAIMTSPLNHQATLAYLETKEFFGLKQVHLFQQELKEGYPNGNGKSFFYFCRLGIWEKWANMGVKWVQVLPVDNPLATPFDPELIQTNQKVELVLRVVTIDDPKEHIGRVKMEGNTLTVFEYTENRIPQGIYLGNTGIFSCTMEFIQRTHALPLPAHTIKKKIDSHWIKKKEFFIFDLFPYANTFKLLISDRSAHFAPLKNASGSNSFETVIKALMI